MDKIEITGFLDFQYVSAPSFSPSGEYAAFVVQRAALEENKYVGDLHILELGTKNVRRLTTFGDAKSYVWTKKGTLLFSAMRDAQMKKKAEAGEEISCWYEISPSGGEAELAFTIPLRVKSLVPMDDDHYAVTAAFDNNRPALDEMDAETRRETLARLNAPAYEVKRYVDDAHRAWQRTTNARDELHCTEEELNRHTLMTRVSVLQLGDYLFVGVPGESLVDMTVWLRSTFTGVKTVPVDQVNGYYCYMATPRTQTLGGYTNWSSWVSRDAIPLLKEKIVEHMDLWLEEDQ